MALPLPQTINYILCFGASVPLLMRIMAFDKDLSWDNALLKHFV